jgi:hypothetical protein
MVNVINAYPVILDPTAKRDVKKAIVPLVTLLHQLFVCHVYLVTPVPIAPISAALTIVSNVKCCPRSVPFVRMVTGVGYVTENAGKNANAVT